MPPEDSDPRPVPPERPNPADCCNSSCNPCIFDLYADALDRYQVEVQEWEEREARRKQSATRSRWSTATRSDEEETDRQLDADDPSRRST